jgi:CheY-like chemotaxis protein
VNSKTALIIDDEADVTTYLASVLSEHGWRALTASSGDEGLALARDELPDVILLDLLMPGGRGGLSTFLALRRDRRLESVPVVFVTSFPEPSATDAEDFLTGRDPKFQPDAYIEKPVAPNDLLAKLEEVTRSVN